MMKGYYATQEAKAVTLETKEHDAWYKFYTFPVKESNVSDRIAGYQCVIERAYHLTLGSSHSTEYCSKEVGNRTYKELIAKGLVKVERPSFA